MKKRIEDWLDRNEPKIVVFVLVFVAVVIAMMITNEILSNQEERINLYNERTFYNGIVTEAEFDDDILIIEFDNKTVMRFQLSNVLQYDHIIIELGEEYAFGINGFDELVEYNKIYGDE